MLYKELYHHLTAEITSGHVRTGDFFPAERDIMQRHGVSRSTVRRTLALLEEEGLVERRQGQGTRVVGVPAAPGVATAQSGNNGDAAGAGRVPSRTVLVLALDIQDDFFSKILRGIEDVLYANGGSMLVRSTDNQVAVERDILSRLAPGEFAGAIIAPATGRHGHAHYRALHAWGCPFVFIDRYIPEVAAPFVVSDNLMGGYLATRHLLELGHRRIGVISAPDCISLRDRLRGYRRALREFDVSEDPALIVGGDHLAGDNAEQYLLGGQIYTRNLMDLPDPPTALFAVNDGLARGCLTYCEQMGLRVPQDLSVVGYNDDALSSYTNPPLTTVRQSTREMGRMAAQHLISLLDGQPGGLTPAQVFLPVSLVIRASSAPPSSAPPVVAEAPVAALAQ